MALSHKVHTLRFKIIHACTLFRHLTPGGIFHYFINQHLYEDGRGLDQKRPRTGN